MKKLFLARKGKWNETVDQMLKRVAEGDLSAALPDSSPKNSRSHGIIRKTVASLKYLIFFVKKSTTDVYDHITTLSKTSQKIMYEVKTIADTMDEFSKGIQQATNESVRVAEEMNDMNHVAETLVRKHNQILKSTESVKARVDQAQQNIEQSVEKMHLLERESKSSQEAAQHLIKASEEMTSMIDLISQIAAQIKILSLNTGIEAARSGEQGKGFLVIANEVGKLAVQSKKATEKMRTLVSTIQNRMTDSSERASIVLDLVNQGVKSILLSSTSLDRVQREVVKIRGEIEGIDDAGKKMLRSTRVVNESLNHSSSAIEELSAGSEEIFASTKEQQANIERMNRAIQDTEQQMITLSAIVSQFKIPSMEQSRPITGKVRNVYEQVLAIRGIMVKMIHSSTPDLIAYWRKKKEEHEKVLQNKIAEIKGIALSEKDQYYFEAFKQAWALFCEVTALNAGLMAKGHFEEAKKNLVTIGRQRFRKITDIFTDWLELLYE
ncbi:hypothetical protein EWH99_02860 [Sporolactobacillus sp. THM7-7]|nr:hypothetical protein EWH99_02860 [Sporolactobacillus sp. THM7-7]